MEQRCATRCFITFYDIDLLALVWDIPAQLLEGGHEAPHYAELGEIAVLWRRASRYFRLSSSGRSSTTIKRLSSGSRRQRLSESAATLRRLARSSSSFSELSNSKIKGEEDQSLSQEFAYIEKEFGGKLSRKDTRMLLRCSSRLDLDHIHLSFWDFCKFHLLVYPNACYLALRILIPLAIRQKLITWGFVRHPIPDYAYLAAQLVLECGPAIFYHGRLESDSQVAVFEVNDFAHIRNGQYRVTKELSVNIDLQSKRVVHIQLDDEVIEDPQAHLTICHWLVSAVAHPKIHAMANWAVNLEPDHRRSSTGRGWASVVTVGYNYMGGSGWARCTRLFRLLGLYSHGHSTDMETRAMAHSVTSGIPFHARISELAPHSKLICFVHNL